MSDTETSSAAPARGTGYTPPEEVATGWAGWVVFGGVMLIMIGAFHACEGFVAIFDEGFYAVTESGLAVEIDYTAWGWVHLAMSALVIAVGVALIAGQTWARVAAVVLAVLGALINLAFLAAYPVWSTIMIVLNVIVIYATVVHGREVKALR
ncbi:DUF7144 family membrane protein [Cryptosporangium aurantiacum]|uniref:DUF7144 domain-containing protein n=1 Tax=Cryptosporangium aurantiacum TaxID=134849 RepID=A0A1M7RFQ2_9ACTN|nr:hypothetical protein [Cryptosporangium aurantiacum]SHN45113.1 hypothetical protein SAMN05443668_111143 [Cryptosporangium aurantiacum]